jgi:hypothetical protein
MVRRNATTSNAPADADVSDEQLIASARLAFYTPVLDQPSVADRKATFLLTMTGLVATTLFLFVPTLAKVVAGPNRWVSLLAAVMISSLIGLLIGAAKYAFCAYVSPLPQRDELTFFRHIASRDLQTYTAELRGADLRKAVEAILHYNHSAATQAAAKYRGVDRAQTYMKYAMPLWMALLLLAALYR